MKFIQCGDLHLDLIHRNDEGNRMYLDEISGFRYICEMVREEKVDLLLITGDLFDNASIRKRTLDLVIEELRDLSPARVFISPGNHDHIGLTDIYLKDTWPDNVHILNEFESIRLPGSDIVIHGAGFRSANESGCLIPENFRADNRYTNILCLHGSAQSDRNYNRMGTYLLSQFDYCALGHEHQMRIVKNSSVHYSYSGSPVPLSFSEPGEHGYISGEISGKTVDVRFMPIPSRRFLDIIIDTEDDNEEIITSDMEVYDHVRKELSKYEGIPVYVRVTLTGETDTVFDTEFITDSVRALDGSRIRYAEVNDETYVKSDNCSSYSRAEEMFIRRMNALKGTDPLIEKALKAGLRALRGGSTR